MPGRIDTRATQVLKESPETFNLADPSSTMNSSILLLSLWMHKLTRQQSNLKLLPTEIPMNDFDSTTKLARIGTAQGTGPEALNR